MIIRAVLFDLADTLVHTERFDYDVCIGRMHQSLVKGGISVSFEDFKRGYFEARDGFYKATETSLEEQDFGERIRQTLEFCGVKLNAKDRRVGLATEAFSNCFVDSMMIDDYLPSLLEQLRRKYRLGVVSNFSFADAGFRSLRKLDIARYFDATVISGALGWRKPNPKIFQEALKALDVRAEEAVFVGDSLRADIEGAKQLGMKTVLVVEKGRKQPSTDTAQFYMRERESTVKPDETISKLAELPRVLQDLLKDQ